MDLAGGITQEDLALFLQEADEQIQLLDEDIIRLEKEADNPELMQEIFRAAHTLKGSSAMVGHQRMSDLAHAMENVLDGLRKKEFPINPQIVDALLHGLDVMQLLRHELVSPEAEPADITEATRELAAVMQAEVQAEESDSQPSPIVLGGEAADMLEKACREGKKASLVGVALDRRSEWASVRCFQIIHEISQISGIIASSPSQEDIENGQAGFFLQLLVAGDCSDADIKNALSAVTDIEKIEVSEYDVNDPGQPAEKAAGPQGNAAKKEEVKLNQTIRVDVSRLDTLMEQVGELVINRNQISQIGRLLKVKYRNDELVHNLGDCLSQITKIVGMLQQYVMSIRLLPIEIVFNTLPRMVRDTARKTDKKVDFIIEGKETEVDRSIIEHLRDPLIHLLRNSVDHGIEAPQDRLAAGKPEIGTIHLSAYNEEDNIIIKLRDDGKGIDPEALRQSAVKKNLISAEAAEKLTDAEAINLIFGSGFSTAREITDVSGRGVGLDVVKTNLELLGGSVDIDSVPGQGTTFILRLPLTLAIIPALLVAASDTVFAVPLSSIVETNKIKTGDIKSVGGREVTVFRDSVLPLLRLEETFGWKTGEGKTTDGTYVVVVKYGNTQVGLIVDALQEQQELVVKSLDGFIGGGNGITGASILGDGRVVLILDVASLIRCSVAENKTEQSQNEVCVPLAAAG